MSLGSRSLGRITVFCPPSLHLPGTICAVRAGKYGQKPSALYGIPAAVIGLAAPPLGATTYAALDLVFLGCVYVARRSPDPAPSKPTRQMHGLLAVACCFAFIAPFFRPVSGPVGRTFLRAVAGSPRNRVCAVGPSPGTKERRAGPTRNVRQKRAQRIDGYDRRFRNSPDCCRAASRELVAETRVKDVEVETVRLAKIVVGDEGSPELVPGERWRPYLKTALDSAVTS